MKEVILNLEQVVSIKINDRKISSQYVYKNEKKYWFHTRPAGIRDKYTIDGLFYSGEEFKNKFDTYLIEKHIIYLKPSVTLVFTNWRENYTKYFDTLELAENFVFDIKLQIPKTYTFIYKDGKIIDSYIL